MRQRVKPWTRWHGGILVPSMSGVGTVTLPVPDAPVIAADTLSSSSIEITLVSGEGDVFEIERSLNGTSGWTQISADASFPYPATGLSASTLYYFRCRAQFTGGSWSAWSEVVSDTTETGPGVGYSAYIARNFQEGAAGSNVSNFGGVGNGMQYSNDIAGPFGEPKVAKLSINSSQQGYGGWFDLSPTISRATLLVEGDMWIRLYHYFPTAFCAGYGSVSDDGYGSTKWIRLNFTSGARLTYHLGGFSGSSCNAAGPTITHVSPEGFPDSVDPWYFWFGSGGDYQSGQAIARNGWHALQFHIHWGATRADSFIRAWYDSTYLGQPTPGSATLPSTGSLDAIVLGDYWNGGSRQNTAWYIGDIIVSREQPTTMDSGGRPYISPSTRVADFS